MDKNGLWTPANAALDATVATQSLIPDSHFLILPFGDSDFGSFAFDSGEYASRSKEIKSAFDKAKKASRYTHISPVLRRAMDATDPVRDNRIFLLTDGEPNGSDSPVQVATLIRSWCAKHRNTRLFYVALNRAAVSPVIEQAINECRDAYIVKCSDNVIPQVQDIESETIHASIEELEHPYSLTFSSPGTYPVKVECDDETFRVEAVGGKITNRRLDLRILPRTPMTTEQLHGLLSRIAPDGDYAFSIKVTIDDPTHFIANPVVNVEMADQVQTRLTLAEGEKELAGGTATWHDTFLWSDSPEPGAVEFDLAPVFANALPTSVLLLRADLPEGEAADFHMSFNGLDIAPGTPFAVRPGEEAKIGVTYNNDAREGKRFIILSPVITTDIDVVNDDAADAFEGLTLRSRYDVVWNPLKTILFWLLIALLIALLLWLFMLKRIFFPVIKAKKLILTGPDGLYMTKTVKGSRLVVYTSRRRSQNILSRIFTGKVLYAVNPIFIPDIEVTAGNRKRVMLRSTGTAGRDGWLFVPTPSLAPFETATATRSISGNKLKIEVQ